MLSRERFAHAVLDESSRVLKAKKIIELLGESRFRAARNILEVGCGSGVISSTLAKLGTDNLKVHAVDVTDNRIAFGDYQFTLVDGTTLPFPSESFDIVISNHVIEHVGDRVAQLHHLTEINRVMNRSASAYLAVPNKWRLVEPHYRLPLLSWLPLPVADAYIRFAGCGNHYDCLPLSGGQARELFEDAGFCFQELTVDAIYSTLRLEFPESRLAALAGLTPKVLAHVIKPLISTLMFRLEKPSP